MNCELLIVSQFELSEMFEWIWMIDVRIHKLNFICSINNIVLI
jgi:hypothetical protein